MCDLSAQVQLLTKRLQQRMFMVENGDVIEVSRATGSVSDFIVPPNAELPEVTPTDSRQLSPTGYV